MLGDIPEPMEGDPLGELLGELLGPGAGEELGELLGELLDPPDMLPEPLDMPPPVDEPPLLDEPPPDEPPPEELAPEYDAPEVPEPPPPCFRVRRSRPKAFSAPWMSTTKIDVIRPTLYEKPSCNRKILRAPDCEGHQDTHE